MNRDATGLAGVRHRHYETLGSTNAEALALARAGERGPLWITAGAQTAGRGRRGREWVSPPGNLYATLLLTEPSEPPSAAQLSFVAAVVLHDALTKAHPAIGQSLALKWPNDLILNGQKVAGILIEAENAPTFAVAIGMGVNCASHPAQTSFPATDLKSSGVAVTPEELLPILAEATARRLTEWNRGKNFAAIRKIWLSHAAGLNSVIQVRLPERELAGRFEGLDEEGRLLLESGGRVEAITAGEVFGIGGAA